MKYIDHFNAKVIGCEKAGAGYAVFLDHTLFYAEAGGQPSDQGTIAGINLIDLQNTSAGVAHILPSPLETGSLVECKIDFKRRFLFMQHHTAEHILSGLAGKLYGYKNVGSHIGKDCSTADFDGELTPEQVDHLEYILNQAIWENVPVREKIIQPDENINYQYRSKSNIESDIRIITVEGYDNCACCGSHVSFTGEIGVAKLIDAKRYKGGTRISLLCGAPALRDYAKKQQLIRGLCGSLSSAESDLSIRVTDLSAQNERLSSELAQMRLRLFKQHIQNMETGSGFVWLIWQDAEKKDIPILASALAEKTGNGMVLLPLDPEGYYAAIASLSGKAKEIAAHISAACGGKGGGSQILWQGKLERLPTDSQLGVGVRS